MRFLSEGPDIPDDLLIARDEGRVVFFCGAGVSRARAGLSDFFGLAEAVIESLGASSESPARKILSEAQDVYTRTGEGGLISADRIFGLLEREFLVQDVESSVAQALKPSESVDLTAHQILLDLARSSAGKIKLVTTNFDRLFEACEVSLKVWEPPRLPNPMRHDEMDGIIHLHGCANEDYTGSQGDGFILSSSEFGRAYLAEGWATAFFRQVIERYVVVFVGYTADDPPIQYLMEALYKQSGTFDGIYAFQSGIENEATAMWRHKGVKAISYCESDSHKALWETLDAWAKRAREPEEWYKGIIELAKNGPERLQPHERGQVAHLVSHLKGMRMFAEGENPPPAEWLCVFDPTRRYATPGFQGEFGQQGLIVDPFDSYGLDSDSVPAKISVDYLLYTDRNVPSSSWDCFAITPIDRKNLRDENLPVFLGRWAASTPSLPARFYKLGEWLSKVSNQPASVWWAGNQIGIHPQIQKQIQFQLDRFSNHCSPVVRKAWHYLFEVWATQSRDSDKDWYDLKALIKEGDWDSVIIRRFASINRPYLKVKQSYWGPMPPTREQNVRLKDIVNLDVEYPNKGYDEQLPLNWVLPTIREFRKNLELAILLETELGGYGLTIIVPIVPDLDSSVDSSARRWGLSVAVLYFSSLFDKLIELNQGTARQEIAAWLADDESIFARLRLWAVGKEQLFSGHELATYLSAISDSVFWKHEHQRDLLLVLANRWNGIEGSIRKTIEDRLLLGPTGWGTERRARASLNRLQWLKDQGCTFTFDFDVEMQQLQRLASDWKADDASEAAESIEARGGSVRRDTEYSDLLKVPLHSLLSRAHELSGRTDDILVENHPFEGLSVEHPVRAFSALTHSPKDGEYPAWAWRTFLFSSARKNDQPRFSALVAERISSYPNNRVAEIISSISSWILTVSAELASRFPKTFDKLVFKLTDTIRLNPSISNTESVRRDIREPDWVHEAINTPVGKIAKALMADSRIAFLVDDTEIPPEWLVHVNTLLGLESDLRRYALTIFASNMNWFFAKSSQWTEQKMLSILDQLYHEDRIAVWSGFLWSANVPTPQLYRRMKSNLLQLAKERWVQNIEYVQVLTGIIFHGWLTIDDISGQRFVSNIEMRNVLFSTNEEFRVNTLEHLKELDDENNFEVFMRDVWPRQMLVRTSRASACLFNLVIKKPEFFSRRATIVLPILTPIERELVWNFDLQDSKETIVDRYPEQVLALLNIILPEDLAAWPYEVEDVIHRIGEVDNILRSDERWLELNRRWNAR